MAEYSARVSIPAKKSSLVLIQPTMDEVPVGLTVSSPGRPVLVYDIKVGKNSQTANVATFRSDVLGRIDLRMDRTLGVLAMTVRLFNDHDFTVNAEATLRTVSVEAAPARAFLVLGFYDEGKDAQEPIEPGDSRVLTATTQVGGVVEKVFFSEAVRTIDQKNFPVQKLRTSPWKGEEISCVLIPSPVLNGLATSAFLEPGDSLKMEVKNTCNVPISARDFVAVIKEGGY